MKHSQVRDGCGLVQQAILIPIQETDKALSRQTLTLMYIK